MFSLLSLFPENLLGALLVLSGIELASTVMQVRHVIALYI